MSNLMTRMTVVGAGAIGGLLSARLARAGVPVNLLARGTHRATIEAQGLTVIESEQTYHARPAVSEQASELGVQDLVFICLKGPALVAAGAALAPLIGPQTLIVPLMNGVPWWFLHDFGGPLANRHLDSVDPAGVLSSVLPARQTLGCVVHMASALQAPGTIARGKGNQLILGAVDRAQRERVDAVAALLCQAGFEVSVSQSIRDDVWAKLWGNMTMNPISALTASTTDVILDDPLTEQFVVAVMEEARALGQALGITLEMSSAARNAQTRLLGAMKTSMLQDLEAGRGLEIDALVAAPYELARLAHVDTPFLAALLGLIRLRARSAGLCHGEAGASVPVA